MTLKQHARRALIQARPEEDGCRVIISSLENVKTQPRSHYDGRVGRTRKQRTTRDKTLDTGSNSRP